MLFKNSNPLLQKAYFHHEIEQLCQIFLKSLEIEAVVQIQPTIQKITIWFLVGSSTEASVILMNQEQLKEQLQTTLAAKQLISTTAIITVLARVK